MGGSNGVEAKVSRSFASRLSWREISMGETGALSMPLVENVGVVGRSSPWSKPENVVLDSEEDRLESGRECVTSRTPGAV